MKFTVKLDLPTMEAITHGLEPHSVYPPLAAAEVAERERAQDLEAAQIAVTETIRRCERAAVDVREGRAAVAELSAAVQARHAAVLMLEPARDALRDATAHRERAEQLSRDRVLEVARERNRELEAAADKLAPVLQALKDLEAALDVAATREAGRGANLPDVTWPECLRDQNLIANLRLTRRGVPAADPVTVLSGP